MIRIAIVDDESVVCTKLERMINSFCDTMQLKADIDIFYSGETILLHLNNSTQYHIIFLDIELTNCNGIEVANQIRNVLCDEITQIVFISGKNGYDRQLFAFRPFSFIAKPFSFSQISSTIEKYCRIYGHQNELFHYKCSHDVFWVKCSDILFFESKDRKIVITMKNGRDEFYATLEKIQEELKEKGFFSPHKSYLVNYRFIKVFRHDCVIMTNGEEIPIAKSKRKEIARVQFILEHGGNGYGRT